VTCGEQSKSEARSQQSGVRSQKPVAVNGQVGDATAILLRATTPAPLLLQAERVLHPSLDTAVPHLSSAPFPRRKGRNWVFALSQGERAKFLTSAPCVQPTIWVKTGPIQEGSPVASFM